MKKRQRKSAVRKLNPVFHIYPEGEKTEIHYISQYIKGFLKAENYLKEDIQINQPTDYSPYGLLQTAKKEKKKEDISWLVFDKDQHPKLERTFSEARDAGISIAFSSICFEVWLLMHFQYTAKAYQDCDSLISDPKLFKKFLPEYVKAIPDIFSIVNQNHGLDRAVNNSRKLCRAAELANPDKKIYEFNPYTNMHLLIYALKTFISSNSALS